MSTILLRYVGGKGGTVMRKGAATRKWYTFSASRPEFCCAREDAMELLQSGDLRLVPRPPVAPSLPSPPAEITRLAPPLLKLAPAKPAPKAKRKPKKKVTDAAQEKWLNEMVSSLYGPRQKAVKISDPTKALPEGLSGFVDLFEASLPAPQATARNIRQGISLGQAFGRLDPRPGLSRQYAALRDWAAVTNDRFAKQAKARRIAFGETWRTLEAVVVGAMKSSQELWRDWRAASKELVRFYRNKFGGGLGAARYWLEPKEKTWVWTGEVGGPEDRRELHEFDGLRMGERVYADGDKRITQTLYQVGYKRYLLHTRTLEKKSGLPTIFEIEEVGEDNLPMDRWPKGLAESLMRDSWKLVKRSS